jgi:hypothetical protein
MLFGGKCPQFVYPPLTRARCAKKPGVLALADDAALARLVIAAAQPCTSTASKLSDRAVEGMPRGREQSPDVFAQGCSWAPRGLPSPYPRGRIPRTNTKRFLSGDDERARARASAQPLITRASGNPATRLAQSWAVPAVRHPARQPNARDRDCVPAETFL